MIQGRENFRFALETAHPPRIGRKDFRQNFERDVTFQLAVACTIDLAHPAGADRGENFIWAKARTCGERHSGLDSTPKHSALDAVVRFSRGEIMRRSGSAVYRPTEVEPALERL